MLEFCVCVCVCACVCTCMCTSAAGTHGWCDDGRGRLCSDPVEHSHPAGVEPTALSHQSN